MTYSELTMYVAMSAVPRLLADTVHSCRRGSKMHERTWARQSEMKPQARSVQRMHVSHAETRVYLSEVSLPGIQGNYRGVMGGQHLPEERERLSEGGCGAQISRRQLHLHQADRAKNKQNYTQR